MSNEPGSSANRERDRALGMGAEDYAPRFSEWSRINGGSGHRSRHRPSGNVGCRSRRSSIRRSAIGSPECPALLSSRQDRPARRPRLDRSKPCTKSAIARSGSMRPSPSIQANPTIWSSLAEASVDSRPRIIFAKRRRQGAHPDPREPRRLRRPRQAQRIPSLQPHAF